MNSLNLTDNQFEKLPASTADLRSQRELFVEKNRPSVLPQWFESLGQLEVFDAGANRFEAVCDVLGRIKSLKRLGLHSNRLKFIPQLERVQKLNLEKNPLNPRLAGHIKGGLEAVKEYLRNKKIWCNYR